MANDHNISEFFDQTSIFTSVRSLLCAWFFSALGWGAIFIAFGWQMSQDFSIPASDAWRIVGRNWLVWSFLTPLVFRFVFLLPIERERWRVALPIHMIACMSLLICVGWLGQRFGSAQMIQPPLPQFRPSLFKWLFFGPNLPTYLTIVSVSHAMYFYRRGRQRELRAVELTAKLAEARLQALRTQIHPHFLFNSLNALGALIQKDTDAAEKMLCALSDFLRVTLDDSAEQELPLQRELEHIERYLAIEKIRFGQRLSYSIEPDTQTLEAHVPALILQPLVENAVRHGIEPQRRDGVITVRAWSDNEFLYVVVHDNGSGVNVPLSEGIGLTNIRSRLREHYGDMPSLTLVSDSGTKVEIRIPLHFK